MPYLPDCSLLVYPHNLQNNVLNALSEVGHLFPSDVHPLQFSLRQEVVQGQGQAVAFPLYRSRGGVGAWVGITLQMYVSCNHYHSAGCESHVRKLKVDAQCSLSLSFLHQSLPSPTTQCSPSTVY